MKKILIGVLLGTLMATVSFAAIQETINAVRTNQIVITIERDDAGAVTGGYISAQGFRMKSDGSIDSSIEKSWDYATLNPTLKAAVRQVVQSATAAMSGEVNESDAIDLGQ